jgi:hypothetical protein
MGVYDTTAGLCRCNVVEEIRPMSRKRGLACRAAVAKLGRLGETTLQQSAQHKPRHVHHQSMVPAVTDGCGISR